MVVVVYAKEESSQNNVDADLCLGLRSFRPAMGVTASDCRDDSSSIIDFVPSRRDGGSCALHVPSQAAILEIIASRRRGGRESLILEERCTNR